MQQRNNGQLSYRTLSDVSTTQSVSAAAVRVLSSRGVRVGFIVATVALGVIAVVGEWHGVRDAMARLSLSALTGSLLVVLAALLVSMVLWRLLLAGMGSPLPYRVAARILFVGQLGKYLPGTVWPVVAQMELGRDHGVPRRRSVTAFVLLMLFTFTTGLLVAVAMLPLATTVQIRTFRWAFLLIPVLLVLLHPRVLNPLFDVLLRLIRRPAHEVPLTWQVSLRAIGTGAAQWLVYGFHIWLLGVQLGADPVALLPLAIGGFALAWCIGYLGVITPAGLGVREVALVAVLSPLLSQADAIVLALASRVLITLADLLLAAGAALSMRTVRQPVKEPSA
jgi:glycosyltransferase 2 family protein